jgi:hypothetical protein
MTVPQDSQWREIPNFPTYWVSQYGQVFSMRQQKLLTLYPNSNGYLTAYMFGANRKIAGRGVPKLVRLAFPKGVTNEHAA